MLNKIIEAVKKAGAVMLSAGSGFKVKMKANEKDYVTEYDVKTQNTLVDELKRILPEAGFLCEETAASHGSDISKGYWFVIDPIDGTTNFMKGFKACAVSVALCRDGELYMSVVYAPFLNELFWAEKGRGAFLNGEPIHTAEGGMDAGVGLLGTSPTAPQLREKTFAVGELIYEKMWDMRRSGSAALDLCYVACGRAQIFSEYVLYAWDFAGGKLIVEEAGGRVTKMDGSPLGMEEHVSVLAGNETAQGEFADCLRDRGLAGA